MKSRGAPACAVPSPSSGMQHRHSSISVTSPSIMSRSSSCSLRLPVATEVKHRDHLLWHLLRAAILRQRRTRCMSAAASRVRQTSQKGANCHVFKQTMRRCSSVKTLLTILVFFDVSSSIAATAATVATVTAVNEHLRPLILLIEAPERAAKHPGVLRRGCLGRLGTSNWVIK
eukprot:scaffold17237_cov62-Phaeocystis_antarctica.AAC.1